jgi:hypothetical protein
MIITGLALYVNMKQAARGEAPFKRSEWTYDCSLTLFIKRIGDIYILPKYSSVFDISCSFIRIFIAGQEDTCTHCNKYSSMLDISCSFIRIFMATPRRHRHSL